MKNFDYRKLGQKWVENFSMKKLCCKIARAWRPGFYFWGPDSGPLLYCLIYIVYIKPFPSKIWLKSNQFLKEKIASSRNVKGFLDFNDIEQFYNLWSSFVNYLFPRRLTKHVWSFNRFISRGKIIMADFQAFNWKYFSSLAWAQKASIIIKPEI